MTSQTWKGSYKSAAATPPCLPEFSKTHWSDTQSTAGIGDGTLTITVDGSSSRVTGEIWTGRWDPRPSRASRATESFTATVRRKDPTDRGFSGHARRDHRRGPCRRQPERLARSGERAADRDVLPGRGREPLMFGPTRYLEWARRFFGKVQYDLGHERARRRPGGRDRSPRCSDARRSARLGSAAHGDRPVQRRAPGRDGVGPRNDARPLAGLRVASLPGR